MPTVRRIRQKRTASQRAALFGNFVRPAIKHTKEIKKLIDAWDTEARMNPMNKAQRDLYDTFWLRIGDILDAYNRYRNS